MKKRYAILLIILLILTLSIFYYKKSNTYKSYNFEFEYDEAMNFQFEMPDNWKDKVWIESSTDTNGAKIEFYYSEFKSPHGYFQPFFSIETFRKSQLDSSIKESNIIKETDYYIMYIFRDIDSVLIGDDIIEEYRNLQIDNREIKRRIKFK